MNYMEEVAHLLGVELEEEFEIKDCKTIYKFSSKHLLKEADDGDWWIIDCFMIDLIQGKEEIVKLPFKPKQDETYWYWGTNVRRAYTSTFDGESVDYASYKIGNCFRTKEEAETKGKELMESIKKEYEQ